MERCLWRQLLCTQAYNGEKSSWVLQSTVGQEAFSVVCLRDPLWSEVCLSIHIAIHMEIESPKHVQLVYILFHTLSLKEPTVHTWSASVMLSHSTLLFYYQLLEIFLLMCTETSISISSIYFFILPFSHTASDSILKLTETKSLSATFSVGIRISPFFRQRLYQFFPLFSKLAHFLWIM